MFADLDIRKKWLLVVTHVMAVIFLVFYWMQQNYEFIAYAIVIIGLLWFFVKLDRTYHFPFLVWIGLCVWMFLHMFGGLTINGVWMYGAMLWPIVGAPYHILKYDQFIHFFCYVGFGSIMYYIVRENVVGDDGKGEVGAMMILTAIIAAVGIGALNEIFEFGVVLFVKNNGIGDYYNTSLDLVFNLFGAIAGVLLADRYS
ncbi:MAG: hypothetical protein ACI83O_000588 [Patescibacteria group bacterium]|jgi:hypothetical protein